MQQKIYQEERDKKKTSNKWFDSDCEKEREKNLATRKKMLQTTKKEDIETYRNQRKRTDI